MDKRSKGATVYADDGTLLYKRTARGDLITPDWFKPREPTTYGEYYTELARGLTVERITAILDEVDATMKTSPVAPVIQQTKDSRWLTADEIKLLTPYLKKSRRRDAKTTPMEVLNWFIAQENGLPHKKTKDANRLTMAFRALGKNGSWHELYQAVSDDTSPLCQALDSRRITELRGVAWRGVKTAEKMGVREAELAKVTAKMDNERRKAATKQS